MFRKINTSVFFFQKKTCPSFEVSPDTYSPESSSYGSNLSASLKILVCLNCRPERKAQLDCVQEAPNKFSNAVAKGVFEVKKNCDSIWGASARALERKNLSNMTSRG